MLSIVWKSVVLVQVSRVGMIYAAQRRVVMRPKGCPCDFCSLPPEALPGPCFQFTTFQGVVRPVCVLIGPDVEALCCTPRPGQARWYLQQLLRA